jgi:hypothetical protein
MNYTSGTVDAPALALGIIIPVCIILCCVSCLGQGGRKSAEVQSKV